MTTKTDPVKEQDERKIPATGFHTNPERINRKGATDKAFRWREIFLAEIEKKKGREKQKVLMARAQINKALAGDTTAFREIADRMEGKAPQGIGTVNPDGEFEPQKLTGFVIEFVEKGETGKTP